MFGEMEVTTLLNLNRSTTLETAVSELLEFTERPTRKGLSMNLGPIVRGTSG